MIIFTLEDDQGEIHGRRTVNFKVCCLPKRDMKNEEDAIPKTFPVKRKAGQAVAQPQSKRLCVESPALEAELNNAISILSDQQHNQACDIFIRLPNKMLKKKILSYTYDLIAGEIQKTGNVAAHQPFLAEIENQLGKESLQASEAHINTFTMLTFLLLENN